MSSRQDRLSFIDASAAQRAWSGIWSKAVCAALGHRADKPMRCRCGEPYLFQDGSATHIRHVLSCFLRHHHYVRLTRRDGHFEYICHGCGHPLLLDAAMTPAPPDSFPKRPRYWCSLFGHRVKSAGLRQGFTEYACGCGHTFLKKRRHLAKITHPARCTLFGHSVRFIAARQGCFEYVCEHCGHPFLFDGGGSPSTSSYAGAGDERCGS
jgi:DNA-directed RNA polymerase subunit RPC12/RpoP